MKSNLFSIILDQYRFFFLTGYDSITILKTDAADYVDLKKYNISGNIVLQVANSCV